MTQNEMLIEYLKRHSKVTAMEALNELGIMRLASRVSDLKKAGYNITREMVSVKTRTGSVAVAAYTLEDESCEK